MIMKCKHCGKEFESNSPRRKYCSDICKRREYREVDPLKTREYKKAYKERHKDKKKVPEKDPIFSCPQDCIYICRRYTSFVNCNYIFDVGEPRGCEAGPNCTKYCNEGHVNRKRIHYL